jgi:hypothetical protein
LAQLFSSLALPDSSLSAKYSLNSGFFHIVKFAIFSWLRIPDPFCSPSATKANLCIWIDLSGVCTILEHSNNASLFHWWVCVLGGIFKKETWVEYCIDLNSLLARLTNCKMFDLINYKNKIEYQIFKSTQI